MVDDVPHAMLTGQQNAALVKLVATALDEQIEACAKVAEVIGKRRLSESTELVKRLPPDGYGDNLSGVAADVTAEEIAAALRQRAAG